MTGKYDFEIEADKKDRKNVAFQKWAYDEHNISEAPRLITMGLAFVIVMQIVGIVFTLNSSEHLFAFIILASIFPIAIGVYYGSVKIREIEKPFYDSYVDIDPELEEWMRENS